MYGLQKVPSLRAPAWILQTKGNSFWCSASNIYKNPLDPIPEASSAEGALLLLQYLVSMCQPQELASGCAEQDPWLSGCDRTSTQQREPGRAYFKMEEPETQRQTIWRILLPWALRLWSCVRMVSAPSSFNLVEWPIQRCAEADVYVGVLIPLHKSVCGSTSKVN